MRKFVGILLSLITVSMFYFSVEFTFLPGLNTKNILAVVGAVCLLFSFIHRREFVMSKDIIILLALSMVVTAITIFSVTYNHTPELSYTEYLLTVLVWLFSAYCVCSFIRLTHGKIDIVLVLNYFCAVSVLQCVAALLIEFIPEVQTAVDTVFRQGQDFLHEANRIYGIGASLDVAGTRFACVLSAIPVVLYVDRDKLTWKQMIIYILCFLFIAIVGDIIARTTLIGVVAGLVYIGVLLLRDIFTGNVKGGKIVGMWLLALAVIIPASIILYNTVSEMRSLFRFGFEGFFNLAETGEFTTKSSSLLAEKMIVFPEDVKTYLIGDGYFENSRKDINYLGDATNLGYYMGTDIGYLRFLFFFGVPGLLAITLVMVFAARIGAKSWPEYSWVFYLVLFVGFIIWFKVATDVFPFLAIGIAAGLVRDLIDFEEEPLEEET